MRENNINQEKQDLMAEWLKIRYLRAQNFEYDFD